MERGITVSNTPGSGLTQRAAQTAAAQQSPSGNVKQMIYAQKAGFEKALANMVDSDAFMRSAITDIVKSPQLLQASPESMIGALMLAAQLRLTPGGPQGHFYLTPKKNHGKWEVLPIVGYRGYFELARRSGEVKAFETVFIREGDHFDMGADSERGRYFTHRSQVAESDEETDAKGVPTRPLTGAIAIARLRDGSVSWRYMTIRAILARRPSHWESTPWKTDQQAMVEKTVHRDHAKFLPMSAELALALSNDEAVNIIPRHGGELERVADDAVPRDAGDLPSSRPEPVQAPPVTDSGPRDDEFVDEQPPQEWYGPGEASK